MSLKNNILDSASFWKIIRRRWILILSITFVFGLFSIFYALNKVNVYTSKAVITTLSPKYLDSTSSISPSLGGLSSVIGGNSSSQDQILISLLSSRELAKYVIEKLDILQILYAGIWDAKAQKWIVESKSQIPNIDTASRKLNKNHVNIFQDKFSSNIVISVTFQDPYLARKLVATYIEGLQHLIDKNILSAAKSRRVFIGEQLQIVKQKSFETELSVSNFYQLSGTDKDYIDIQLDFQPDDIFDPILIPRDIYLSGIELIDNERKKNRILKENKDNHQVIPSQLYLEYLMKRQQRLSVMSDVLYSQYLDAAIEEKRQSFSFNIVDKPYVPLIKSGPNRKAICVFITMLGGLLSLSLAFFLELRSRSKPVSD